MSAIVFCLICETVMNITEYEHPAHQQKCKRDPKRHRYEARYQFKRTFGDNQ
jgi:uncharacterized Zn finger protein (UPF0148 family)